MAASGRGGAPAADRRQAPADPGPVGAALLVLALLASFLACTGRIDNNDYGFHLRLGEEIAQSGRPPRVDEHSFTARGAPYADHEWGSQLLFHLVRERVGDGGMGVLQALLVTVTLALVAVAAGSPLPVRLAAVSFVLLLGLPHVQMRPHLLAWVLSALLVVLLERKSYPALLPLFLVWANLHGSVLLGVGVAGLHLLEEFRRTRARRPLLWAAACALVPLLNPYGLRVYTVFFEIAEHMDFIGEWKPYLPGSAPFWLLIGFFAVIAVALLRTWRQAPLGLVLVAVLAVLAFRASRNGVMAAIVLAPLLGRAYGPALARWPRPRRLVLTVLLALPPVVTAAVRIHQREALRFGLDEQQLPIAGTDFVLRHGLEGPLFNDYNFGGYLLWRAWPTYRVFVDGRAAEIYKGQPLDDYLRVSNARAGWRDVVSRHGIRFFLVRPEREIALALLADPAFELLYFDYNSAVFVRRDLHPEMKRLRVVTPFGYRDPRQVDRALDEVDYLLGENPLFFGGYKIRAFLLARRGDDEGASRSLRRYLELHPRGSGLPDTRSLIATLRQRGAWR